MPSTKLPLCLAVALAASLVSPASKAVDFNWTGAVDSDWLNGANWSPAGPPSGGNGNFARFPTPTVNQPVISADVPVVQDYLTGPSGVVITQTAGNAFQNGWMRMGAIAGVGDVGTYNLSGGVLQATGYRITEQAGQVATINVSGGEFRQANINLDDDGQRTRLGLNGTANVNLSGTGLMSFDSNVLFGAGTGTANVVITGGKFEIRRGQALFGVNTGTANVTQSGGLFQTQIRGIVLGADAGGSATYTLSAGKLEQLEVANTEDQSTWNHIGRSGTGTFNLSGGTASYSSRTHIGANPNSTGTVNQTGGTFEVRDHELIIGDTSAGTYNISAGILQTSNARPINVGNWNNGNGNLNVSGTAQVNAAGGMIIGQAENNANVGSGIVTQTGGTVTVGATAVVGEGLGGNMLLGARSIGASGTYNLQGGTLDMTGKSIIWGDPSQASRGTAAFNMTGGNLRNVNSIAGNSLDSTFTQQGGVFEVGALSGPGSATTVNGNYSLGASGSIQFEITEGIADQLAVNGTVAVAGTLSLQQFGPISPGSMFTIVANDDADPVVGQFSNAPHGVPFSQGNNGYVVFYNAGDGNDIILIPEPASAGLIGFGAMACAMLARRRRQA